MKKYLLLLCTVLIATAGWTQQEPQFTQYMYNKMGYNPGYAGSNDAACITAIYRQQWIGLDGAPGTQLITFNMPLQNKRIGIGASVWRNTIGISETLNAEAAYSYRIRMGRGILGIGVMASVRLLRNNYDQATPIQSGDETIPTGLQSKYVPNFGMGAYFSTQNFYIGASAPRVLENSIDFAEENVLITKEVRHIYIMGGVVLPLSETVKVQPQVLLKYVQNAPFDADANVNLVIMDRYTIGMSYRIGGSRTSGIGESIDVLLGAQVTDNLLFGLAYDVTLSELRDYNSGSIEAVIKYCIGKSEGEEYLNPRFF